VSNISQLISLEDEVIIYEGQVYKYKPGLNVSYLPKWLRITNKSVAVYKDEFKIKFDEKPEVTIPLEFISDVCKVLPVVKNHPKTNTKIDKEQYQYKFEVY